MTLPVELETSVNKLRVKHTALIDAVNAYRSGTVNTSKQDLLDMANDIDKHLTVEEHTLLGQVARKGRMPSLLLDFANGKYAVGDRRLERFTSLGDILSFSRSTGGGRFNAQGQYEWVPANTPRIDYDPETGECRGLLVEEQRTNLAPHSVEANTQYYASFRVASRVEAIQTPVSSTASYIESDGSAGGLSYFRLKTPPTEVVTVSFVAKAGGVNYAFISYGAGLLASVVFNLATGEITIGSGMADSSPRMIALGGGWYRCIATVPEAESRRQYIGVSATKVPAPYPADVGGIYITGIQFEVGSFPTSYIPTEGSAVTRAADVAVVSVGDWFNVHNGSVLVEAFGSPGVTGSIAPRYFCFRQDSANETSLWGAHIPPSSSTPVYGSATREGAYYSLPSVLIGVGEKFKAGVSYGAGRLSGATEGAGAERKDVTPLSPIQLAVGNRGTGQGQINGHIKRLEYYPFAMTMSELEELTKP